MCVCVCVRECMCVRDRSLTVRDKPCDGKNILRTNEKRTVILSVLGKLSTHL